MLSVDTNVVIRFLTNDDRTQAMTARSLFKAEQIWIPKTVALEIGWVLENHYGYDTNAIRAAFSELMALDNVQIEDEPSLVNALALMVHGVSFPDALHLASTPPQSKFVTFDRAFVRRAQRAGVSHIHHLRLPN
jgi:predicted nucleic-acid-binding protein